MFTKKCPKRVPSESSVVRWVGCKTYGLSVVTGKITAIEKKATEGHDVTASDTVRHIRYISGFS